MSFLPVYQSRQKRRNQAKINASDQCYVGKPNSFGYGLTKGALG